MQVITNEPTFFNSRMRFNIILPLAVLALIVVIIGIYLSTRLVVGPLEERFTRELIEAGSLVGNGLASQEQIHLSQFNAIAFTDGIDEAILANDQDKLRALILPMVVNNHIDRVDILNLEGMQLLEIHHPIGKNGVENYTASAGADLSDWPAVKQVINGVVDKQGDKIVTLAKIDDKELFVTIGPVKQGDKLVGAVLVSSYIQDLLRVLRQSTFADVTLYDLNGQVIRTTLNVDEKSFDTLTLDDSAKRLLLTDSSSLSLPRSVVLDGREYDLLFGVFQPRGDPLGFYSVALQRTYIASYGASTRNYMVVIFAMALALAFGTGYFTASAISKKVPEKKGGLRKERVPVNAETGYKHIILNEAQVPLIAGTTMKVVELVLDHKAYGWSPEELHFQHPYLTLGQIYSALAFYRDHQEALDQDIERRLQLMMRYKDEIRFA